VAALIAVRQEAFPLRLWCGLTFTMEKLGRASLSVSLCLSSKESHEGNGMEREIICGVVDL